MSDKRTLRFCFNKALLLRGHILSNLLGPPTLPYFFLYINGIYFSKGIPLHGHHYTMQ